MPRNSVNYQSLALFAGPAPWSGYHFVDSSGNFNNNFNSGTNNTNLIEYIDHIDSVDFSFSDITRQDVTHLGNKNTISTPIINYPLVDLTFSYFNGSLRNEHNLGFHVNHVKTNGDLAFETGFDISCISGFVSRELVSGSGAVNNYPLGYRDKRNYFVVVGEQGKDIFKTGTNPEFAHLDSTGNKFKTLGFGNGYLVSYTHQGSINSVPSSSVRVLCENFVTYNSGSGIDIPAIDPLTRTQLSGTKCNIPGAITKGGAILPGDITIDIASTDASTITDVGVDFTDLKIQGYSVEIPLNRSPLESLGYKLPRDREVDFPVFANANLNVLVGEYETGSLDNLVQQDKYYNLAIKLVSGNVTGNAPIIARFDLRNAQFQGVEYTSSIGSFKTASLNFRVEVFENKNPNGVFMSGIINA